MKHAPTLQYSMAALVLGATGWAQVTQRMSVATGGAQSNGGSVLTAVSADGRYVAFASWASDLVNVDANGLEDIFVRDWQGDHTEIISVDSSGAQGDGPSYSPAISADGRFVTFVSDSTNLVPGDTNGRSDIFVRDRSSGTTERVSISSGGAQANDDCFSPSISADGRYVAFESIATNLGSVGASAVWNVYVHDRSSGVTELISVNPAGFWGNGGSGGASISADGRYVAFQSVATDLVPGDTNGYCDVFVRDRNNGTTIRVSVDGGGGQANGPSITPSISADGLSVAFASQASNLIGWDTNGFGDIYISVWPSSYIEIVSVDSSANLSNGSSYTPSISGDGREVAFQSDATNLVSGDTNAAIDIFVRDRSSGTTERVSVSSAGFQGNGSSETASISADGRFVAFASFASFLVSGDTNAEEDVFLRDRAATGFTSVCHPGVDGVIPCPCSNPPGVLGRGCDNSSFTGGASLSASGVAYLSMDSLVFTTSGERSTAFSVLLQGTTSPAAGLVYGQGVRCVGGSLKRLYAKAATNGSITAPDLAAGDPPVSVRSAATGDVIQPGQSRWYLVYYRDPTVLGGCPASSTFNATETGRVGWNP